MRKEAKASRSTAAPWLALVAVLLSCSKPDSPPAPAGESAPAVRGVAPPASGGFPSVVLLVPETGIAPSRGEDLEPAVMDQYGMAFYPKLLLVSPGQPVDFKNSEDVLHNVHVVDFESRETVFNVGTPVVGSYRHTFERPGAYDVSCDIHPSMAAFLFVADTPFAAVAEPDGSFAIEEVPPGRYQISIWNLDPNRRLESTVEVGPGTTELNLVPSS